MSRLAQSGLEGKHTLRMEPTPGLKTPISLMKDGTDIFLRKEVLQQEMWRFLIGAI